VEWGLHNLNKHKLSDRMFFTLQNPRKNDRLWLYVYDSRLPWATHWFSRPR